LYWYVFAIGKFSNEIVLSNENRNDNTIDKRKDKDYLMMYPIP
jgi:hypothetical protein